jgi:hypothetical protein
MNNIITDFTFNIVTLYRIEMPPVVITHGQLLYDLEKNSLIPVLDRLAWRCQLDGAAEGEIIALLKRNNDIQDFFKGVAIGTKWASSDALEKTILDNYSHEATQSCTDDLSTAVEKWAKALEGFGSDLTEARKNWDESMALLRSGTGNPKKSYAILQKELLQKELKRQWLSQWAIQQMMTNLDCMQRASSGIDSIADWSRARTQCIDNPLIGYEKLRETYEELKVMSNRLIDGAKRFFWEWETASEREANIIPKDTDQYIRLTQKIDKTIRVEEEILLVYWLAVTEAWSLRDEEATTNTIITNIVNTHTSLVGMNWLLEKRIPKQQENCMKWSPGVIWWCYKR